MHSKSRQDFIVGAVFLTASLIAVRLFYLQVLCHDHYQALAAQQHFLSFELPASRGEILSSDGFPLATNETAYLLYVEPQEVRDAPEVAQQLLPIFREDLFASPSAQRDFEAIATAEDSLVEKLTLDLRWVALARRLSEEQRERIQSLDLGGLGFEEEPRRFYPEGRLAGHVLGFVASDDSGQDRGYFGVEGFYDGDLRGRPGKILEERDAAGNPIVWGEYHRVPPQHGRNLVLTLDRAVQFLVEEEIKDAVAKYGAMSGTVIVLDPKTGAVWAMANYPSFDPAELVGEGTEGSKGLKGAEGEEVTGEERRNFAIAATYEPGSVMKMMTMSAGIDTGQITPQTTFYDAGPLTISGHTVDTWDGKHYGEESMIGVLQHSNNVGAAWVAQQLGVPTLRKYLLKFGLGEPIGIDLEGEDTGVVKEASEWRAIDLATAAFGQGISATPLQVASAFAVAANDGVLMRPYLVARILDGNKVVEIQPQEVRRVLSNDSAEVILKMLEAAVEGGESRFYNLPNYKVAGKTGTAQIPRGGRYDPRKTNATFVGFFAKSKKFVMLVKLEEPSSSIYAAETAVPTWMQIAQRLALYWGIEPDH